MGLKKLVINIILKFFSIFLIFCKQDKKKITFISLESDHLENDFKLINDELVKENKYHLNYILVKFNKNLWGNFKYMLSCIHQLFAVNTSALVILDYNNYVVCNFKKENVKVLQLWHASGAIKKFGNETFRDYFIKNYDYVICNCEYFKEPFARAFGVENKENVKVTGLPQTDVLFNQDKINQDKEYMYTKFPQIKGKKVICYAPTFRGKLMHGFNDVTIDLKYLKEHLSDEYVILYKLHPLLGNSLIIDDPGIINCHGMDIRLLFSVSDLLISDYSAIIIEYSTFERPMIFYVPDLDEYRSDVGLYVDYENVMPGPLCTSEQQVVDAIVKNDFDLNKVKEFKNTFFTYQDGKATDRVVKLVDEIMK